MAYKSARSSLSENQSSNSLTKIYRSVRLFERVLVVRYENPLFPFCLSLLKHTCVYTENSLNIFSLILILSAMQSARFDPFIFMGYFHFSHIAIMIVMNCLFHVKLFNYFQKIIDFLTKRLLK